MSIKEFNYITKEGDNTPRTVFVLEEDANYIKGIDLTHVDKTVKEEIIRTFNYLDSIISNNMDSFRSFKVDSIVENWYAYIKKDNIIVSKFAPKSYAHKMTIEEAVEWQGINPIPFKLTGNKEIDEKIKSLSSLVS